MSKWEKLLQRIHTLSANLRFAEVQKVLESHGYVMKSPTSGSSHCAFRKPRCQPITIPKHDPIKRIYIEKVHQVVEKEAIINEEVE